MEKMRGFKFEPYDVVELASVTQETRGLFVFAKTRALTNRVLKGVTNGFVAEQSGFLIAITLYRRANCDTYNYEQSVNEWVREMNTTDPQFVHDVYPYIQTYTAEILSQYPYVLDYYYWFMQEHIPLVAEKYGELSKYNGYIYAVSRIVEDATATLEEGATYVYLKTIFRDDVCLDYALKYLLTHDRIFYDIRVEGYRTLSPIIAGI